MATHDAAPKRRGRPPSGGREAIVAATLALLREQGISNLTTRAVAARAGVSEASVFYHFGDRAGLLSAAFKSGLEPLAYIATLPVAEGEEPLDRDVVLQRVGRALEDFFDQVLPVLVAAQADTELRDALAEYLRENDLGSHRGVEKISAYLRHEQESGRLDAELDVEAVAVMLIGSALLQTFQRMMLRRDGSLPAPEHVVDTLNQLLD